jgi:pimeloyl-ACP methyl ester carboxylesterase/heme/copper-type cytochrome/quinol oxidase subunit 4
VSRLRLQLVATAVFTLAYTQSARLEPKRESGILPIDPPTPYIHYLAQASPHGRVLVVHGLDVSKEVMRLISAALADGGFEVYNIDLPGHGDSTVTFQTERAQQAIRNAKNYLGNNTIVLGHSLGAGLLLDLSATETFSTMVLLAPPPLSVAEIRADRVLIATGEIDIPRIRGFVAIAADIGNPKVESWILPWGGHSAPIFNPGYVSRIVEWLGGDADRTRTLARLVWISFMFVSAVALGSLLLPNRGLLPIEISTSATVVAYIAAAAGSLLILKLMNPLQWLRLFASDYLISFVLVTGLGVLGFVTMSTKTDKSNGGIVIGIISAAFVITVPGLLIASHFLHMSLSDGRWWRFPFIAIAGLPLFLSDELTIRRIQPRWKAETVALITRGLFLAFILTGVLTLNRTDAFLVLIAPLVAGFWIALWFASGVVHRYTRSPLAAAIFASIVQGWAFAAWFVTI